MIRSPALLLGVALGLSCGACSGSNKDTATATPQAAEAAKDSKAKKDQKGRSYDNPDAAITDDEKDDILQICAAIVHCDDQKLSGASEAAVYKSFKPKSEWGKLMVKHLQTEGRAKAGSRVARMLKHEDLKWASSDCRTVVKRYAHTYQ